MLVHESGWENPRVLQDAGDCMCNGGAELRCGWTGVTVVKASVIVLVSACVCGCVRVRVRVCGGAYMRGVVCGAMCVRAGPVGTHVSTNVSAGGGGRSRVRLCADLCVYLCVGVAR